MRPPHPLQLLVLLLHRGPQTPHLLQQHPPVLPLPRLLLQPPCRRPGTLHRLPRAGIVRLDRLALRPQAFPFRPQLAQPRLLRRDGPFRLRHLPLQHRRHLLHLPAQVRSLQHQLGRPLRLPALGVRRGRRLLRLVLRPPRQRQVGQQPLHLPLGSPQGRLGPLPLLPLPLLVPLQGPQLGLRLDQLPLRGAGLLPPPLHGAQHFRPLCFGCCLGLGCGCLGLRFGG